MLVGEEFEADAPVQPPDLYLNRSSLSTRFVSSPVKNKDSHSQTMLFLEVNQVLEQIIKTKLVFSVTRRYRSGVSDSLTYLLTQ